MSNTNYNLDADVNESFQFTLGGHEYNFRYPTTEEIDAAPKVADEKKITDAEAKEQTDYWYTFITPVKSDSPSIADAIAKANVKVAQNFNRMMKAEFSSEE